MVPAARWGWTVVAIVVVIVVLHAVLTLLVG